MSSTQPVETSASLFHDAPPAVADVCPLCEQPIPPEKLVEIQRRERERAAAQEQRLRAQLNEEKRAALVAKQSELDQVRKEAAAAVRLAKQREAEVRRQVEAAMAAKCSQAEQSKTEAQAQLKELQTAHKRAKAEIAKRESAAREAGKNEALKTFEARMAAADESKRVAEKKAAGLQEELRKQRESLDKAKQQALARKDADSFREREKLLKTNDRLRRQLENKTANERGEGAEIDLYDALRDAFDDDKLKRIGKGEPGADIWHDVKHGGRVCGRIVYDSKDHGRWSTSFGKKLREDQLSANADHAVLALVPAAFPTGARQLDTREGVILANPSRVVALVAILP